MSDTQGRGDTETEAGNWQLLRAVQTGVVPVALSGAILSLVGLVGYWQSVEVLYRPFENGPATHPATFISFFFLSLSLLVGQTMQIDKVARFLFLFPVLLISLSRLSGYFFGLDFIVPIIPFHDAVNQQTTMGLPNQMGLKTSFLMLAISLSLILSSFGARLVGQIIGIVALVLPTVSLTGFAYGITILQGDMSMTTTVMGYIIALAVIGTTADIGFVRVFLSPYIAGRMVRFQVLVGIIVPLIVGYILIRTYNVNQVDKFSLMIVVTCWFISMLAVCTSVLLDKIDRERRLQERKLNQEAQQDPLTGLFNRRAFEMFAHQELDRIRRNGNPVWLLILDLDHFKKVNDTAGHPVGDKVLKEVASVLTRAVRATDVVARVGGEEFAVLLVDTNQDGTARVAENLRLKIANMVIVEWTPKHGPVTASIGGAPLSTNASLSDALKLADTALYKAKDNGRNQVQLDTAPHQTRPRADIIRSKLSTLSRGAQS